MITDLYNASQRVRRLDRLLIGGVSLGAMFAAVPALAQGTAPKEEVQAEGRTGATQGEQGSTAPIGALEEIVVTATRSATNLQDTPLAITAVTSEALEQRAFTSIQDIAAIVPNASFNQAQAAFGRAVTAYVRGIGQNDFNLAFEPGVAFYVDDQYYALLAGSVFDLLDLERVEVLRGPQGTTFGRGAIGGAVNLIPKAPGPEPEAYVEATYGRYNRQELRAGFNYPLTDNLFFRFSGVTKNRKGYQKLLDFRCDMNRRGTPELAGNFPSIDPSGGFISGDPADDCVIDRYGGEDVQALRGAMRYEGSRFEVTLSGDYTNDQSPVVADKQLRIVPTGYDANGAPIDANGDGIADSGIARLDQLVYQPLWGIKYDQRFLTDSPFKTYATYADPIPAGSRFPAGCVSLPPGAPVPPGQVACTYYNGSGDRGGIQLEREAVIENWGVGLKTFVELSDRLTGTLIAGYRDVFTTGINDTDGSPLGIQTVKSQIRHDQYTIEPRLNYDSEFINVVAGLFYYKGDGLTTSNVSIPFLSLQQNARISVKSEAKAAYAQAVVHPIEGLGITLGGRYSEDEKKTHFNNGQGGIVRQINAKDDRWDYRIGADYQFTEDLTVYGSIASGYRPPAFNPRPFQASQLEAVEGEELVAYELGFKGDLFERRLRVNIAGFYSDYKQRITPQGGSECLNNGTRGQCVVPGGQVDPFVTGGPELCRNYNPATDGPVDLSRGIGVTCISRTNYVNTPGKVKGIEAELEARPVDGLLISLSGGYTQFDAPELENNPIIVNDDPLYVPKWTGSAGIQYEIPVAAINGSVTPRLDAFYQSKLAFNSTSAAATTPGRTTFNGRLTYQNEDGDFQVAVGATNLFNKKYYYNIFDLVPFGQPGTEGQPGRPREWYVQVKKRF